MNSEPDLPRSVVLALWLRGAGGTTDMPDAADAAACVEGDDEPHRVHGLPGVGDGTDLGTLVTTWTAGPRTVAALLPSPGDPAGVPAAAGHAATEAGECVVVTTPAGSFAAVPAITPFGSHLEPGHLVEWQVHPVPDWSTGLLGAIGTLSDAERELRSSLITATEALDALDVARWRDDAREAIERLRSADTARWPVPELDGRRARVLQLATRLRAIVALGSFDADGRRDDGGAVNLWQADQRSTALREVDRTARHAISAATFGEAG
ncbi:hypothetical protein [Myceligenerans crystallogenes]|uniref:Uncharacterized protein n=1 Tax=Myceligenerans crystallogenes TaxID=316335 RepID=A0ABN2NJ54_9MICO